MLRSRRSTSGSAASASSRVKNRGTTYVNTTAAAVNRLPNDPQLFLKLRIGIHTSTAGSLERSAIKAHELGANTFQIFSASPRMWRAKAPDPDQIHKLKELREKHDLTPLVVHDSYLINLAAAPSEIREKSIDGFRGELERTLLIGANYLVTHPGNYKGMTIEQGMLNVAEALARAWRGVHPSLQKGARLTVLLENTAGAGAQLGGKLDELADIRELAGPYLDIPIGYCLDTCHCYVSGFDVAHEPGFESLLKQARATLGLQNVPVIHTNDAKTPLNSHSDRHANIGAGYIGLEGFRRILNHPDLRNKAFILETPVDKPGDDLKNVTALKELVSPKKHSTPRKSSPSGTSAGRKTRRST
ncbi:MAG: deoxyribonuclease IV [Acidobacteriaceae bacterium]|nr:deoxyribonuclease IV [Acidobacteriaceae bacterium]